jgi:hypothetical protein
MGCTAANAEKGALGPMHPTFVHDITQKFAKVRINWKSFSSPKSWWQFFGTARVECCLARLLKIVFLRIKNSFNYTKSQLVGMWMVLKLPQREMDLHSTN